jgi:aspartyl-tRNA(Asn)/glutamyl-tRNA(Gln) amidotransferase subunit C
MANELTRDDVVKVAVLARLKLTEAELETYKMQLGQVLQYVDILNEVDTTDVEPMAHVAGLTNVLRDDTVVQSLPRELALDNAAKTDGKYFLVPQILET